MTFHNKIRFHRGSNPDFWWNRKLTLKRILLNGDQMPTTKKIYVNASDFAKYTGDNTYCSPEEIHTSFWSSNKGLALAFGIECKPRCKTSVDEFISNCNEADKERLSAVLGSASSLDEGSNLDSDLSHALSTKLVAPAVFEITNHSSMKALEKCTNQVNESLPSELGARVKQAASKDAQRQRGIHKEKYSINKFSKASGKTVQCTNRLLSTRLCDWNGYTVMLRGMVDGMMDTGEVIEVKERRRRLFNRVVTYENVQLHCYMKLTDTKRAMLREQYDETSKEYWVDFDADFWEERIRMLLDFLQKTMPDSTSSV